MIDRFMLLLVPASLAVCTSFAVAADSDPLSPRFDITRFEVRGNTLLPASALAQSVAPFVGPQRDFSDVAKAQEALEDAFHRHGYQLVRVDLPEQELNGGVVVLDVVQVRIGQVAIVGNQHFSAANVRQSLPGLQEGASPDLAAVSKSLKLANENPAKQTVMKLKSGTASDTVDADLQVSDESPWNAALNIDNSGSKETGRTYGAPCCKTPICSGATR